MFFMNLLSKAAPSSRVVTIDSTLGNVLMAGSSPKGMNMIMTNYAIDCLNKGGGVIIFRDVNNGFEANPSITTAISNICQINNEEFALTRQFDPFSCFSDSQVNSYIIDIFDSYSEVDKNKRMSYQNYIALIRNLLQKKGKKVRLNELAEYDFETVEQMNNTLPMPDAERIRNERFLNSFLPDAREIESYFSHFASNTIGEILSGNQSLEKILQTKPIIEVSLDFDTQEKESELLMTVLVDNICKLKLSNANRTSLAVIANEVPNEMLIKSKFHKIIKSTRDCKAVYSVADLSNLVKQSNDWIEYADSYFFFKQNSNDNKDFCSKFFGTYEKTKETRTKGVTRPTFGDMISGKGTSSRQSSTSYTTEKEAVYLPDVFANLPENEAIYFFKSNNEHMRLTVY